jgi:hypothetical protein
MQVTIELTGTSSLLMHNERLSNPNDRIVQEIKSITSKGKDQTDKDRDQVAMLEWFGSLYEVDGRIVVPAANVIRCLREAAAITKKGRDIARSMSPFGGASFDLLYEGPQDKNKLWANPVYRDQRLVKVQRGRILRTRPCFPKWGLKATFILVEEMMSFSTLDAIVKMAGLATGLCDGRIIGFGRFDYRISKL